MYGFIINSFPIVRMVLLILTVILSIFLIIVVMFQQSSEGGLGAISGETDTYFSKNKEKTLEGTLKRLTVILSCSIFATSILFFLSLVLYSGT